MKALTIYPRNLHRLPLLFLFCALLLLVPHHVLAATGKAFFGLHPVGSQAGYFTIAANPGQTFTEQVKITNAGTATGDADIYAVDGYTADTSGASYYDATAPRTDVGKWLHLSISNVQLPAGKAQIFTLHFTVPMQVRPGAHLGAVVAEDTTPQVATSKQTVNGKQAGVQITIKHRTVMAVVVNVSGTGANYQNLDATQVQASGRAGYQTVLLSLANTGNTLLQPYGTFTVQDSTGAVRINARLTLDTFVPQTHIAYPVAVQGKALDAGNYTAQLDLRYGSKELRKTFTFSVTAAQVQQAKSYQQGTQFGSTSDNTPYLLYGAGAVIIILLLVGLLVWMRRGKKRPAIGQLQHNRSPHQQSQDERPTLPSITVVQLAPVPQMYPPKDRETEQVYRYPKQ